MPLLKLLTHLGYIFKGQMKAEKKQKKKFLLCFRLLSVATKLLYHTLHSIHLQKIFMSAPKYRFRSKKEIEVYFVETQRNLCTNYGVGGLGSRERCLLQDLHKKLGLETMGTKGWRTLFIEANSLHGFFWQQKALIFLRLFEVFIWWVALWKFQD